MNVRDVPIPEQWPLPVRRAMLHVASLARWTMICIHSASEFHENPDVRAASAIQRRDDEIALLSEHMRILKARLNKIEPGKRPHYPPAERMAILEMKAARGWNLRQAAEAFLVEPETVASWMKRLDEEGGNTLVQITPPINKFPQFVRHIVRKLKVLCPGMGKKKIAEVLARARLRLSATSVARMLESPPARPFPVPGLSGSMEPPGEGGCREPSGRVVTARHPNHVWHVDLTTVPTSSGFWVSWFPFSFPQVWPFCYWVALIVDHFTRKVMGFAVFNKQPTSVEMRTVLGRAMSSAHARPRHLISDKGPQFWNDGFKKWARRKNIRVRYGAVGKCGSIAVIERFILSLKSEFTRRILVPLNMREFRQELAAYVEWYNRFRPHERLKGRTPEEIYSGMCGKVRDHDVRGKDAVRLDLTVSYLQDRRQLPVVELRKAA